MKSALQIAQVILQNGPWVAKQVATHGRPGNLVHFYGQTPGDDLMCTVVLHEMRVRQASNIWMMTRFPELFTNNPDVDRVVPFDHRYERMTSWLGGRSWYAHYGGASTRPDKTPVPQQHIIALMCEACGISGDITVRPYLHLTTQEASAGRIASKQIALHSSGMTAHSAMLNKEWVAGRMQAVATALQKDFTVIQLGAAKDVPLEGCVDLRGKTSMRESASIIANSQTFVGQVGFLMHLARAVDRPSVIVYGGRELPWQSGYSCNTNLSSVLYCSPCWEWNLCVNPITRQCLSNITVDEVVAAVYERVARSDEPVPDDLTTIGRPAGFP